MSNEIPEMKNISKNDNSTKKEQPKTKKNNIKNIKHNTI